MLARWDVVVGSLSVVVCPRSQSLKSCVGDVGTKCWQVFIIVAAPLRCSIKGEPTITLIGGRPLSKHPIIPSLLLVLFKSIPVLTPKADSINTNKTPSQKPCSLCFVCIRVSFFFLLLHIFVTTPYWRRRNTSSFCLRSRISPVSVCLEYFWQTKHNNKPKQLFIGQTINTCSLSYYIDQDIPHPFLPCLLQASSASDTSSLTPPALARTHSINVSNFTLDRESRHSSRSQSHRPPNSIRVQSTPPPPL